MKKLIITIDQEDQDAKEGESSSLPVVKAQNGAKEALSPDLLQIIQVVIALILRLFGGGK